MRIWWLFGLDRQDYRQDQEKLLDALAVLQKNFRQSLRHYIVISGSGRK